MRHVAEQLSESLQRRRRAEAERRPRIFNYKLRTIGVDRDALDMQITERKKRDEAAEEEQNTSDAEMLRHSEAASLLHRRQVKEKQVMEKAIVDYWHRYQQPRSRQEPGDVQMMLPGLVGEDLDCKVRQQRQGDQLRRWLSQQQSERDAERNRQKMEEQLHDLSRVEMATKALQLQSAEMAERRAAAVATKDYNLATITKKEQEGQQEGKDDEPSPSVVGVPGLSSERSSPPESLQQIIQIQRHQIEEKHRLELEKKQAEEQHDRTRVDSARAALLLERQQARMNRQLRRNMDRSNMELAQKQREKKLDAQRGNIDDSFFSQFNTCSR